MQDYVTELLQAVDRATPQLIALGDAGSQRRPAAGGWSPREVIGHLVDSASNNHGRFVRAQFEDGLVFAGYAQEHWVAVQRYHEAPWIELVTLWGGFNRHLSRVMAAVPPAILLRPVTHHNLHEVAWNAVPRDHTATLDYFMRDYVAHLQHHLRQALGSDWTPR